MRRPRRAPRPRLGVRLRRGRLERAALAVAEPRRHELRAARGARRHPVAVLDEDTLERDASCTAGCGRSRCEGPPAAFHAVEDSPPAEALSERVPAAPDHRPPARLLQHRRADRRLRVAAAARRGARAVGRRTRRSSGVENGERVRVSSARGSVVAPGAHRPVAAPGPRVHDAALPRRGRDQPAHDQRDRPEVGHRGVQGHRHPRRPDRPGEEPRRRKRRSAAAQPAADGPRHPRTSCRPRRSARRSTPSLGPARVELGGCAADVSRRDQRVARGGHAARAQRHLLLPVLHAVQARVGWISRAR